MSLLSQYPQYQLHIVLVLVGLAMAWLKVADMVLRDYRWYVQVKQGVKGVLIANSDSWAMVQFKSPVWMSWCLAVQEVRVFVYQYHRV